jgi:hypothetical protein
MAKYYIKSYKKIPQSFLAMINSFDDTTGSASEPYEIKLERVGWFGRKTEVIKNVYLPIGFNHSKELTTGRQWVI